MEYEITLNYLELQSLVVSESISIDFMECLDQLALITWNDLYQDPPLVLYTDIRIKILRLIERHIDETRLPNIPGLYCSAD